MGEVKREMRETNTNYNSSILKKIIVKQKLKYSRNEKMDTKGV